MRGKTVVITGATSGIGEVAAIRLAEKGARIVFTARDRARADATMAKLQKANPASEHVSHLADLSLLAEQKRVAGEIAAEPQIDVLINNAGALFNKRRETAEGLEQTFALNHMSYFTITNLLLPRLKPGARIVSTASDAHKGAFDNFEGPNKNIRWALGMGDYATSKLCNIWFTRELARRIAGTGITANALHPGFVATGFGDQSGGFLQRLVSVAKFFRAIPKEEGAKTIIYLASSPDVANISGEYFYQCKLHTPTKLARNDVYAKRLWEKSAELAGVG